jgi:predicted component of type VI protein secretion system
MSDPNQAAVPKQAKEEVLETSLLDQIVEDGKLSRDASARERGKDLVKEFVGQVLEGAITVSADTEAMINARIAQIDHLLSIQLNEILHHAAFQKLESTWRGLRYLLDQSETSTMLKIRVMNCSKRSCCAICSVRPSSTRARSSRRFTKKSSVFSAARLTGPSSAITSSASTRRTSNFWRRCRRWPPARTLRS